MAAISMVNTSCSDTESYAELLADETKSVNYFLANHHVINEIPEDSIFETGEDAPYYRMDDEGNIYMQVLKTGDTNNKATTDQRIYFRFMRYNLNTYASYGTMPDGDGNADDMSSSATYFVFNNYNFPSSTSYGSGLQTPLYYLGIDCEVNIVIKSQYGLSSEISYVEPYLYNIRYFKSMI
jgi:hypothetical protein